MSGSTDLYTKAHGSKGTYQDMGNIPYSQMEAAAEFVKPDAIYSTQHGVKGEEYDTVIFVVGRGWNNYKFDEWMPRSDDTYMTESDKKSYERNRNLFYVCCSRAKKHLVLLVTVKVDANSSFMQWLRKTFGENNVKEYSDFMEYEVN